MLWVTQRLAQAESLSTLRAEAAQRVDADVAGAVLDVMVEKRFLVPAANAPTDAYRALVGHVGALVPATIRTSTDLHCDRVFVFGEGRLASRVTKTLGAIGLDVKCAEQDKLLDTDGLHVAVSENDDLAALERLNRKAVMARRCLTFVRRTQASVAVGPCVVPGQTGCLSCYLGRQRSGSAFTAEFDAFLGGQLQRLHAYDGSPAIDGLVDFVVAQHVLCLAAGLQQHAEPGRIYSWHLLSGQMQERSVLKLPRCEVCGKNAAVDQPARAVRALL